MSPSAIFTQNARSTSRRIGGRPGDLIAGLPACVTNHPDCLPITHLHINVLRRPVESAQYLSIRYSERLAANAAVASVGSRGDSYDNALAETIIGLYKTELVRHRGPWRGLDDLELATLEWIDWFNNRRLHHHNAGRVPPAEAEDLHYRQQHSDHQAETQTKQPA